MWFMAITLLVCSCSVNSGDKHSVQATSANNPSNAIADSEVIPLVTTVTATTGRLPLRRQTNGRLRARRQVVLKSQLGGVLTEAPIEGRYYRSGQTLLTTDPQALQLAVDRARAAYEEAAFRQRDLLLRLSTNLPSTDSSSVSELAKRNILIQSGLPTAEVALKEAEFQLSLATLSAPFAARAADVKVQIGHLLSPGEEVCALIDMNSLEVEFFLLEAELPSLQERRTVYVNPVARPDVRLAADLDIINPTVDDGGLLRVRAKLTGRLPAGLYPGMNVAVTVAGSASEMIVLPKAAIIERSGRDLVFAHDSVSGLAKWQYVTVAHENDEQVAISEGVEAGQAVIVAGNLTLDHDSPVRVD